MRTLFDRPTPVHEAAGLAAALGLDPARLWIKRDDLIGLGGGGNKVRKLQLAVDEALRADADTLVTTGAPQSNHARLTAAVGARVGLAVELVLAGAPAQPVGNVLLDHLLGASLTWTGEADVEAAADALVERLRTQGRRPHRIPFGGSSSITAQGYVEAAQELEAQLGDLDHVVVAVGSGGTMAGLVHHLGTDRVLGVHCGAVDDPRATVGALLDGMGGEQVAAAALRLDLDQVGAGYAHLAPGSRDAMLLLARTEGILLDPTYTGRAAAGLVAAADRGDIGPRDRVVLLHSGGLPGAFAHPELAAAVIAASAS